jgi:hypothetical protein
VSPIPVVQLDDAPDGPARTTRTLLASLVVRTRTLALLSGSQTVGSLVGGVAALGREASADGEGARIRAALERTRPGINAEMLWSALSLGDFASIVPPTPVLEDLRNDVALLLADDLEPALADLDALSLGSGLGLVRDPRPVDVLDVLVGIWVLGRFAADAVELLSASAPVESTTAAPDDAGPREGSLLR